jgi:hypothetical protein
MRLSMLAIIPLLSGIAAANAGAADDWHLMLTRTWNTFDRPSSDAAALQPPVIRTGTGQVTGMSGGAALYAKVIGGPVINAGSAGTIERIIPLEAWRGKRAHLTLRLKSADGISASISTSVGLTGGKRDGNKMVHTVSGSDWQSCSFVRDIPANASDYTIYLHLYGRGTLWIDGVALEAADDEAAAASSQGCIPDHAGFIRNASARNAIPLGTIATVAGP